MILVHLSGLYVSFDHSLLVEEELREGSVGEQATLRRPSRRQILILTALEP